MTTINSYMPRQDVAQYVGDTLTNSKLDSLSITITRQGRYAGCSVTTVIDELWEGIDGNLEAEFFSKTQVNT